MKYLKVHDWEQYQHYNNRNPPWIKLHVDLLNNRKFTALALASKGLLMQLWILASRKKGEVPSDLEEIRFQLRDHSIKQKDIDLLVSTGFLETCKQTLADASNVQADACLETEVSKDKAETDKKRDINILSLGSFGNVKMSEEEFQKLKDKFGEGSTTERIEKLSSYIASKGKKYKSHYATILVWAQKDGGTDHGKSEDRKGHDNSFLRAIREENGRRNPGGLGDGHAKISRQPGDFSRAEGDGGISPDAHPGRPDRENTGN
ncbi:MAG: hypothetical protein PHV74_15905 [Dehalococcoidia bacterium]|nr:hypothetical protein [Dehalococcoidia bacterium]